MRESKYVWYVFNLKYACMMLSIYFSHKVYAENKPTYYIHKYLREQYHSKCFLCIFNFCVVFPLVFNTTSKG